MIVVERMNRYVQPRNRHGKGEGTRAGAFPPESRKMRSTLPFSEPIPG